MREKMQVLADVWQQPGSVTLEYGGKALSAYDVERSPETGKPKAVGGARLFETSYVLPQLRLFALEEAGWLTALKIEDCDFLLAGNRLPQEDRGLRSGVARDDTGVSRIKVRLTVRGRGSGFAALRFCCPCVKE